MKIKDNFKILWKYLKYDKGKLISYLILVMLTYIPVLFGAYFWGKALEYLIANDFTKFMLFLLLWESIYILCYSILQIPRDLLYKELEVNFLKRASKDMYKKIDDLPARAFEDIGVGELINRLYNDPDRIMDLLSSLIRLICKSLVVIAILVVCFKISFILAFEIIGLGFIMGIISYKFFPKIKKTQESIKKESETYVKTATENISGIREIKALDIKKNIEKNINDKINNLIINTKKQQKYSVTYFSLNNLTYFILQFIILLSTGKMFITGSLTFAMFSMIESYIWRIDEVVESISDFGVNYNKVAVSLKRIDEIVNNKLYDDEHFGDKVLNNPKGIITFKDVEFHYRDNEDDTLKKLNMTIEPNKKIAIIGKSGNGKSTIFNLLLRYFDTSKGEILIDNINIKDLTEDSLRKNISIIRQSPFLFNLSLFDNFKIVKDNVTLDEIREECKKAYIDDYIMSLPDKYNTIIGEGGVNLSGGQKQRIAIARTLLLNTKIILFDEATSALDNESQNYIKKTIDDLVKDHTVVIVAHRLSTIIDADIINVINKGILEDNGTHKELLKSCKSYKKLYEKEENNKEEL